MPELPEVETIVAQLAPRLRGQRVLRVELVDPKLKNLDARTIAGRIIRRLARRGKYAVLELAETQAGGTPVFLCVHLRMTGRLIWTAKGQADAPGRPPRARLILQRGVLSFFDTRRLGVMWLCRSPEEIEPAGRDPLAPGFTARVLAQLIAASPQEIKPWLMRQDRLSGVGNIYAAEALFHAGIHPARPARSLTPPEIKRLHAAIRRILKTAIKNCGVTISDFQDSEGRIGSYQKYLRVYGRVGERCKRCRSPIQRIVQQQRSTCFCPKCQR